MDPQIIQVLKVFQEAINANTEQLKALGARIDQLEIRCEGFTTYTEWKRIEEGFAQAVVQSGRALHLATELRAMALGEDDQNT